MTNKFPIGSQWKTRAGHRAVVVGYGVCSLKVWHEHAGVTYNHYDDGTYHKPEFNLDLLTPWQEPRKGTFWVNINENGVPHGMFVHREDADTHHTSRQRIACVEVNWQENQGL